jgi:hypothetical protein
MRNDEIGAARVASDQSTFWKIVTCAYHSKVELCRLRLCLRTADINQINTTIDL